MVSKQIIRIGTRGSQLARWQADHAAARLREWGAEVLIEIIETTGDKDQATEFGALGAKGIFVKEIETALLERRIDIAVHSLKDLPTELPDGLVLGAVLERESPFDGLVSRERKSLAELPQGARLATGSLRRAAQALALRPDLRIVPLRGNVPTRVRKIREGEADATLMAAAGLRRLGMETELSETFSPEEITPAMGQGAMAVESRAREFEDLLAALNHHPTRAAVDAERIFLHRIGGGCKTPAGVLVRPIEHESGDWLVTGMLASPDGKSLLRTTVESHPAEIGGAALALAESMIARADEAIKMTLHPPQKPT
ncbi:hydroxymethylbilane synthase [Candidatus Sumerlaeota bacterium]|nr:hydroxymethylbilane synthase [Candidatus Sumerlaeota bacterium]